MSSKLRKGSVFEQAYLSHSMGHQIQTRVLRGDFQVRCRELLIQVCDSEEIEILRGVVGFDHIHMHLEYAPNQDVST